MYHVMNVLCIICTRCVILIHNVVKCCVFVCNGFSVLNFVQKMVPDADMYPWFLGPVPHFCHGGPGMAQLLVIKCTKCFN
jgi:hypothetical protein